MKIINRLYRLVRNQKSVFWIFLFMLILPNCIMFFTESTSWLTRAIGVLLPLACYWGALTFNKRPGIMFWWLFLFIFLDAFEIVLLFLFGESPIAVDMFLNVVTTNVTEVDELLSNLVPAVGFVCVVYITGMVLSVISIRNEKTLSDSFRRSQRWRAGALLAVSLVALAVNYFIDNRFAMRNDIFPVNGVYNMGLSGVRLYDDITYDERSRDFTFNAVSSRPDSLPEVYVLVVGETLRADNLGIYGYERNTTPCLSARADGLVTFSDVITMSNTTHKSVPLLLTAVASQHDYDSLYTQKGIITAFAEAGYRTAFYSNQRRNHSFIDHLGCEAQEVKFLKDDVSIGDNVLDIELLHLLDNRLDRYDGGKLFIVLHCYGSHFNYYDRYPREQAVFKPDGIQSAEKRYRDELINSYDNTAHYADLILGRVIERLDSLHVPAAMLFTSDHGEDIYDDKRGRFLHASPLPTYYQLRVPLLVWTSSAYREHFAGKSHTLRAHARRPVSSNMVTFHTLLDLAGVRANKFDPTCALSNEAFVAGERYYVNDHNEFRTLDNCGLKKLDIDCFNRSGLRFP